MIGFNLKDYQFDSLLNSKAQTKWLAAQQKRKLFYFKYKIESTLKSIIWPLYCRSAVTLWTLSFAVVWILWNDTSLSLFISCLALFAFICVWKFVVLMLLRYRRWLTESKPSSFTKVWAVCMKLLIPEATTPNCFKFLLPSLPLPPSVEISATHFVKSMNPILSDEEHIKLQSKMKDFLKGPAHRLQFWLYLKAFFSWNWLSDWWTNYAYLINRGSLWDTSVVGVDVIEAKHDRMDRIAILVYSLFRAFGSRKFDLQKQIYLNGIIPVDMDKAPYLLGAVRIPQKNIDAVEYYDPGDTGYFMLKCKRRYFKINLFDDQGEMLPPPVIKYLITQCHIRAQAQSAVEIDPSVCTCLPRERWANVRKDLIMSNNKNAEFIETIEKSAFFVHLEDDCPLDRTFEFNLHGNGTLWYDKSSNFISFSNGKWTGVFEHSIIDGLIASAARDYTVLEEHYGHRLHGFDWFVNDSKQLRSEWPGCENLGMYPKPQECEWGNLDFILESIVEATEYLEKIGKDVKCYPQAYENIDRSLIKKCKLSPDSIIQTALILAYTRMHSGKLANCYQPATLQTWHRGRTENIRPLSSAKIALCRKWDASDNEKRINMLRNASAEHSCLIKSAMSMQSFDRHLFALKIIAHGMDIKSDFLDYFANEGNTFPICTSALQAFVTNFGIEIVKKQNQNIKHIIPYAGMFRNATPDGYSVFVLTGNDRLVSISFIASRSSEESDPKMYAEEFEKCILEMQNSMRTHLQLE